MYIFTSRDNTLAELPFGFRFQLVKPVWASLNGIRSFTRMGSPNSGWKFNSLRASALNTQELERSRTKKLEQFEF
jgi:hypothetical protein